MLWPSRHSWLGVAEWARLADMQNAGGPRRPKRSAAALKADALTGGAGQEDHAPSGCAVPYQQDVRPVKEARLQPGANISTDARCQLPCCAGRVPWAPAQLSPPAWPSYAGLCPGGQHSLPRPPL